MSTVQDSEKALDQIINEMVDVVSNSKDEIFSLGEEARKQQQALERELTNIKQEVKNLIDENDQLERKLKLSRLRLSEVSKNFDRYSEEEVHEVYNHTHNIQTQIVLQRQKEEGLIKRREELEQRIRALGTSIERSENLMSKTNVILNYLKTDFKDINETIQSAKDSQEFGLKIIEAQEEERRSLSREMHDGPAQMLANVMIRSEIVGKTFRERGIDQGLGEVKTMKEMVRKALYEVRRIIYDLRPMALDDLGLVPTLRKYIATTEEYHQVRIEFILRGRERRFTQQFETAAFRLIQEALQNALKHAEARIIRVVYEDTPTKLNLHITDDGKGFNPNEKNEESFGLIGMRERIDILNGEFSIESSPGSGTRVKISIPHQFR
uniref:sensor histidine kinase n=1 Tax=uncultured Allobacillus sp. TaxID=1638025 RepID=UPI00259AAA27|nr:sensor histidine kinase [uncultured Allobacillus sp.]